jgi:hypothetical protein
MGSFSPAVFWFLENHREEKNLLSLPNQFHQTAAKRVAGIHP